jgi:Domain of unknown function (DUF4349)
MSSFDVMEQIRASRPSAPDALRERIRTIAAAEQPARPPLLARFRPRRLALVAAPSFAVLAVLTAGAIGLARSGEPSIGRTAPELDAVTATQSNAYDESKAQAQLAPSAPSGAEAGAARNSAPAPTPGRAQRYEAFLRLRVSDADELSDSTQRALRLTRDLGGFVVSLQSNVPEQGTGGAELTVRVPRERVQEAIVGFSELGTILAQQVRIDDLQGQVDSLNEQIADHVAEIARIRRQLARPNLPLDTRARLSARLAEAQRELRELRASRQQTTKEAAMATVTLSLTTEKSAAVPAGKSRLDRALEQAGEVLAWEAAAVVLFLVAVGPVALLAMLAWLGLRVARRRADDRLLERA